MKSIFHMAQGGDGCGRCFDGTFSQVYNDVHECIDCGIIIHADEELCDWVSIEPMVSDFEMGSVL